MPSGRPGPMPMSENMICSGTFEGGKTRAMATAAGRWWCRWRTAATSRADRQLGAERSSGRCEETATFSAYTNIANFVPWLNEVIQTNP